jgi:hypothetical protein
MAESLREVIEKAAQGARTMSEVRRRLAIKAQAGDLDDAIWPVFRAKRLSREYVAKG